MTDQQFTIYFTRIKKDQRCIIMSTKAIFCLLSSSNNTRTIKVTFDDK